MKILVVGGGGREHALCWKIDQSQYAEKVFWAPGNAGIAEIAECVPIAADNIEALADFARRQDVDLTVVGPEAPLCAGIADRFLGLGLPIFGPRAIEATVTEGSKIKCKQLMQKYGIPTAPFETFSDPDEAYRFLDGCTYPKYIKADGLCGGKGALRANNRDEAYEAINRFMVSRDFGDAGARVVIEDMLVGNECSVIAIVDGVNFVTLPAARDYKRALDNDEGDQTGGMGSYSPVPDYKQVDRDFVKNKIFAPMIAAIRAEGMDYRGALYAGLMLTVEGPKVVEFNCRFGDPETQAILPLLTDDIVPFLLSAAQGKLNTDYIFSFEGKVAICRIMASGGYPGKYEKGKVITGIEKALQVPGTLVFHAGTARRDGQLVTDGGRVLGVTTVAENFGFAIAKGYAALRAINFNGAQYRCDIATNITGR